MRFYSQYLCCAGLTGLAFVAASDSKSSAQDRNSAGASKGYTFGTPGHDATFDYVIVGGGTAGLTLATRLAEKSSLSIAVIEAGGFYESDTGNISVVPGYDVLFSGTSPSDTNPLIDWGFTTVSQAGAANRKLHYARGKTMGGSSARNFLLYHRPTTGSLDLWADQVGDQSYSFKDFFPFYQKSVHYTPPSIHYKNSSNVQASNGFVSDGGPLQVSFGKFEDPFGTWAQKAFKAIGQAAIKGFQIGQLIGSAYMPFTENPINAHRSSSESSFLQSTKYLALNLTVYNNTLAEKIIFHGTDNVATGVTVSSHGTEDAYTIHAKGEVILSAGAFQSPQLLMVSGIGPRNTLQHFKIPVLHDSPGVGQNLQDQPIFGTSYRVDIPTGSASINSPAVKAAEIASYNTNASGPLTNGAVPVIGWDKLSSKLLSTLSPSTQESLAAFPTDWPHLEYIPIGAYTGNGSASAILDTHDGNNYATIATALITPSSRGNITLGSSKMADPPLINPNWLTHPADAELAVAAFKRQRQCWSHLSPITVGPEYFPGPQVRSDTEILEFIRRNLSPIWHAAATCKMGKSSDRMAVVDPQMRVYGTRGLRVVDASAFPFLPPGHPQSSVYALAEKAAVEILGGLAGNIGAK